MKPTSRRLLSGLLIAVAMVLAGLVLSLGEALFNSHAQLSGQVDLGGLHHAVRIERDRLGIPVIRARDADDAYEALGFVQAQERFFEMDLLRRVAAGRLAALVGPAAARNDERVRRFRLEAVVRAAYARATPRERARLIAYSRGVNAGLHALRHRPFPYALLGVRPSPWHPWDSYLVIGAMYLELQDPFDHRSQNLWAMHRWLPPALDRFLTAPGNRWDAPLRGRAFKVPAPPPASVFDLHALPSTAFAGAVAARRPLRVLPTGGDQLAGSNAFAVAGRFTRTHAALLANDMHLHLALPPIWYRAEIEFRTGRGRHIRLLGVTLPGVPALVVGTNFHVAWGFTNTEGDWVDLIRVRPLPGHPDRYRTPRGIRHMTLDPETIHVRGGKPLRITVRDTIWGPVVGRTPSGVLLVSRWVGEDPRGYRINAERALERARNVRQAISAANRLGIPEQNFVTADRAGQIGWSVAGAIPRRVGDCDPVWPQSWAGGQCRWQGYLKPRDYPRIVDPRDGLIWTANQRIEDGRALRLIGDGGYDLGARAQQIRNDLQALKPPITARDLLAIELDDRARYLAHWQRLLTGLLTPAIRRGHPKRAALDQMVSHWQACACTGSVGYRLVWKFRKLVFQAVLRPFDRLVRKHDPHFKNPMRAMAEGPVWWLVTHQPPWLLAPQEPSWHALLIDQVDRLIRAEWHPGSGFRHDTWGRHNRIQIANPVAAGIPVLGPWLLDLPPTEIPGDSNMPRVQTHALGATERMVVDLGDPARSLFELPGGESGNPGSPFYRDQFRAWLLGLPTPLAPGRVRQVLRLIPARAAGHVTPPKSDRRMPRSRLF